MTLATPTLHTARLRLRPFTDADADPLFALHSSTYVMRYWDSPPWNERARAERFIAICQTMADEGTGARVAIDRASDGTFVGWCGLTGWNPDYRSASLGYCLDEAMWGHGYATEAAHALLQWAFDTLDLNRVQAETDTRNVASARVLEKNGFVREGTLREDCVVNGEISDSWVFGLIRREWRPSTMPMPPRSAAASTSTPLYRSGTRGDNHRVANSQDPLDVLIVGAGPTGLSLAAQLERYGARFRIIDRRLDRVNESRALAVQPRTLEVLSGFGTVTEKMVEGGNPAVRLKMHVGDRAAAMELFDIGVEDTAHPYLLFLSQAETERILIDHLGEHAVHVERDVELVGLDTSGEEAACTLRHGDGSEETATARYVVGCDGAHSTVRQKAGIPFDGRAYPQTFVLADLEADGLEPGWAHAFLSQTGMLFFFPLGTPATWRLLAMRHRSDTTPVERPVELTEVQRLADEYTSGKAQLHDPVWMTNFRLHNRGARHYRRGPVFLAGDAAHIHSPAGAQGMNTGIQDSVNLGWKLGQVLAGRARPELLDTYERERAPVGRKVLRFTDRAFTIGTSTNPLVRFARTRVAPRLLPLAVRLRAARAYGLRTVSQLGISYRSSPLSLDGASAPRRGPRAGDRLPDAPVSVDGRKTTLHSALTGPDHHLLLCGPSRAWPALDHEGPVTSRLLAPGSDPAHGPGVLVDVDSRALHRLGVAPGHTGHFLVRPDGHIAYRAGGTDLSGAAEYLTRWHLS